MMESTYSCSSFSGLVSSKRRLVLPPNSAARPKLRQMDLAWPMCRYPLGSGGKRVCTRPANLLVFRSQVGLAAELGRQAEVEADGFGVANVQISVGLGGKAGLHASGEFVGLQIFKNDFAYEIGRAVRGFGSVRSGSLVIAGWC